MECIQHKTCTGSIDCDNSQHIDPEFMKFNLSEHVVEYFMLQKDRLHPEKTVKTAGMKIR